MDFAGEELGCGIAPAEFGELIEIAIVELGEHRLQQVKSAADITNDPIGVERVSVSRPSLDDVYLHYTGRDFTSEDRQG